MVKPSKPELEKLYRTMTLKQIGDKYEVHASTVMRWMIGYDIPRRAGGNYRRKSSENRD